ncbi:zf-HC2 domain-containing protein, partial [Candidatus Omnitrophota bacterium]
MQDDAIIITCDDIKKKLKPFQQDLLAENEYKAFAAHVDECPKCKQYIGSIDFLSNQLWKLGDVKVPSDLSSTILFKLTQP